MVFMYVTNLLHIVSFSSVLEDGGGAETQRIRNW